MKKHYGLMLFFVALVSIGWTVCSQAMELVPVTSFDSTWMIYTYGTGTGTLTTDGAKVNLSAQGSDTGERDEEIIKTGTTGVVGMWATIRVDQATNDSTTGTCLIGLYQYIGKVNNSKIQLMISLNQENNKKYIRFRVRAVDLTTNATKVLTWGTFGDRDGGWANGDSKTVAFARVGSEFWFYVEGEPGFIKIQALDEMTSYNGSPSVSAWADKGTGNSISGSVSNIFLIKE